MQFGRGAAKTGPAAVAARCPGDPVWSRAATRRDHVPELIWCVHKCVPVIRRHHHHQLSPRLRGDVREDCGMSRMRLENGIACPCARIRSIRDRRAMLPLLDEDASLRRTGSPRAFLGKLRSARCPRQVVALVPRRSGPGVGTSCEMGAWASLTRLSTGSPCRSRLRKGDRGILELLLQVLEGLAELAARERVIDPGWPPVFLEGRQDLLLIPRPDGHRPPWACRAR